MAIQTGRETRFLSVRSSFLRFAMQCSFRCFDFRESLAKSPITRRNFMDDIDNGVFSLSMLPENVWTIAGELSQTHTSTLGTRSLDILHVATAVVLRVDSFLTFDRNQEPAREGCGSLHADRSRLTLWHPSPSRFSRPNSTSKLSAPPNSATSMCGARCFSCHAVRVTTRGSS